LRRALYTFCVTIDVMTVGQLVFGWIGVLLQFALLAILITRRHYRRLPFFTLFVGGVGVSNAIVGLHYTWETWMLHQVVAAALRFAVALELTYCIFGAFPAAAITARRVMLVILLITAATAIAMATPSAAYTRVHAESIPRLASAAIWMLTALAGLLLWYRLPLAPLPRAILMGYAPYLLIFTIGISLLFDSGMQHLRSWVGYVDTLSFHALILYWCTVAWRTAAEASPVHRPPAAPALAQPS
jgi:hypothetical protein